MARINLDLSGARWLEGNTVAENGKYRFVLVDCGIKGPIDKLEGDFDIALTPDWDGKLFVAIGKSSKVAG